MREDLRAAQKHLRSFAQRVLKRMKVGDLTGLSIEANVPVSHPVNAQEKETEITIIRGGENGLKPVGICIDPPGVCYPIP